MRTLLVFAAAALALPAAPALADHGGGTSFSVRSGDYVPGDRHHRRHRDFNGFLYVDREYQGDTLWRANSFNDWWHERPNRSYPRWMQNNANCERKWWAGSELRC